MINYSFGTAQFSTSSPRFTSGCNGLSIRTAIASSSGFNGDPFPCEFRPEYYPESLYVILPDGWVADDTTWYVYTQQSDAVGTAQYMTRSFSVTPTYIGDTIYFYNDGTWPLGDLKRDYGNGPRMNTAIQGVIYPTCETSETAQPYATGVNFNSGTNTSQCLTEDRLSRTAGSSSRAIGMRKPELSISALNPINEGITDTNEYRIQICDLGYLNVDAENVFASVDDLGGGIEVLGAYRSSDPTTLLSVRAASFSETMIQVGLVEYGVLECDTLVILYGYNSCSDDSVEVSFGWNCDDPGYPSSVSTYPCPVETVKLYNINQEAEIQLSIIQEPDSAIALCDTLDYVIEIKNVRKGHVIDGIVNFFVPAPLGTIEIISGSVSLNYPSDTASPTWVPLSDPVLVGASALGAQYQIPHSDFMVGFEDGGMPGILATEIRTGIYYNSSWLPIAGISQAVKPDLR